MPIMQITNTIYESKTKKKKDEDKPKHRLVLDIVKTGNSKEEVVRKLKEIDDNNGGTSWNDPGYMKHDICNALISATLGIPSAVLAAGTTASLGPIGIIPGILGLYLTGQIFHLRATKYDKFHLLEHYEDNIKRKKKALEAANKREKDPATKKEIERRIKEADSCIKLIEKERKKLLPKKVQDKLGDGLLDDSELDLDFDWDDEDDWVNIDDIEIDESAIEQLYPVFIINAFNHEPIGKIITAFTKDKYSHSLLSLDSSLRSMYSFNGFDKMSSMYVLDKKSLGVGGLVIEDINRYIKLDPETDIQVMFFFVKEAEYNKLKETLDYFLNNYKITRYDLSNIFNIIISKSKKKTDVNKLICSQFVDIVLKLCDIDLGVGDSNLVTPGKLSRIKNPNVYIAYEGKAIDYNYKKIDSLVMKRKQKANSIKEAVIQEAKSSYSATFDNAGNLIISKKDKLDIEEQHKISKKMFNDYKHQKNVEAMKYEANKLWYMDRLVSHKLEGQRNKDTKLINLHAKLMNEFSLYVREINKLDKNYNFEKEYSKSPFCNAEIKLHKTTLTAIKYLIQTMIPLI